MLALSRCRVASRATGLFVFGALLAGATPAQARWTPLAAPPGRAAHAMAYDAERGQIVVHGGQQPGAVPPRVLGDTWVHDGVAWRDVTAAGGPGPRTGHAMAYDAARQRVVLFGGFDGTALRGDTWEWDGATWTLKRRSVAPSPRFEHAMAFDAVRRRTVLFGGADARGAQADTWEWDGMAWMNVTPPGLSPPPLRRHAMAYDSGRQQVVSYGGSTATGSSDDTWLWDGRVWSHPPGLLRPPRLEGHALVGDDRGSVWLFGGLGPVGPRGTAETSDQTWVLDSNGWRRAYLPAPPRRTRTAAVFALDRVVLFGGTDGTGNALADAWSFHRSTWTLHSGGPFARSGHAMATRPGAGVVLFGGWDGIGTTFGDTWIHDGDRWAPGPSGPPPRRFHAMAYAPQCGGGLVVMFGGIDGSDGVTPLADTWWWTGRSWLQVPTGDVVPPPRYGHALARDATQAHVVMMFGGTEGASVLSDTWVFDCGFWRRLSPATSPPARAFHAMAMDPARQRVVLFGGAGPTLLADTWEWDGANWQMRTPATSPPARSHHAMTFDTTRMRVVLSGGRGAVGVLADTWEWDGATWRAISVGSSPPARQSQAMASDLLGEHVLEFGGEDGPIQRSDTWRLAADPTASYELISTGCSGQWLSGPWIAADPPSSRPWLGDPFTVRAINMPTGWTASFLFTGFSDRSWGGRLLPLDLTPLGMPGCRLAVEILTSSPMTRAGNTATWSTRIPNAAALIGQAFYNQALVLVPGANAADAVVSHAQRGRMGQR